MSKRRPRPNGRSRLRDGIRQAVVVVTVGAILVAAGLLATREYVTTRQHASVVAAAGRAAGSALAGDAQGNAEIYTGSILYMPYDGRTCRQFLFDNLSGRLTDNGSVDCASAAYESGIGSPKQWSAARARVISSAFRAH
jgi:hypothetical protein